MTEGLVYLDSAATMPLLPEATKAIQEAEARFFANASALHTPGHLALNEIEETRELLAHILNCNPDEIIFVSSASEANNTVIQTFAGHEIVTSPLEHHSLILPAKLYASKYRGLNIAELTELDKPKPSDTRPFWTEERLTVFQVEEPYFPLNLPLENARLYSYMLANNEIGEILDVETVASIAHKEGSFIHSDLTQCLGKIPLDVRKLGLDYATVSAHKIGGPVGVAALYVKKDAPFVPLILGGNQERKRRGGTYNTVGIIGFKAALQTLKSRNTPKLYAEKVKPLRDLLAKRILNEIPGSSLNTPLDSERILPNILNASFEAAEGESIQLYLDAEGIIVSTGSACAAGDIRPSHVLMAKTGDAEVAHSSVRFSFGLNNTEQDVERVMAALPRIIEKLQGMSTIKMKGRK